MMRRCVRRQMFDAFPFDTPPGGRWFPKAMFAAGRFEYENPTTISAFTCRDNFVYTTGTAAYTFMPYTHTIPLNGVPTDFTAAKEQIRAATGGTHGRQ